MTLARLRAEDREEALEEGERRGIAIGEERGRTEGIAQGERKKALETARNALAMGLTAAQAAQLTGLSADEITRMQQIAAELENRREPEK